MEEAAQSQLGEILLEALMNTAIRNGKLIPCYHY